MCVCCMVSSAVGWRRLRSKWIYALSRGLFECLTSIGKHGSIYPPSLQYQIRLHFSLPLCPVLFTNFLCTFEMVQFIKQYKCSIKIFLLISTIQFPRDGLLSVCFLAKFKENVDFQIQFNNTNQWKPEWTLNPDAVTRTTFLSTQ